MADEDGELRGVGGWLGFFVVIMAVLTPIAAVALTATALYGDREIALAYGAQWSTVQAFEWVLVVLSVAGALFIAYRLMRVHNWATVRITIAGIWMIGLGALLVEFFGIALIIGAPMGAMLGEAAREFIRPIVFGVIWTSYFLRSERVANTYGRDAQGEEAAAVFS